MEFLVIAVVSFGLGCVCGIMFLAYGFYQMSKTNMFVDGKWIVRE